MIVESLTVSMFATNCYLAACPATGEAIIIDPGGGAARILQMVDRLSVKVLGVVNTHGHIDHVAANAKLKDSLKCPIYLNRADLDIYRNPGFGLGYILKQQPGPDIFMVEGDTIEVGELSFTIIETPGHTPGGVCLLSGGNVFSGDTLFAGSVGRTDLAGGSFNDLLASIKSKLMTLPGSYLIYPGHGPSTTIAREVSSNPFINQ